VDRNKLIEGMIIGTPDFEAFNELSGHQEIAEILCEAWILFEYSRHSQHVEIVKTLGKVECDEDLHKLLDEHKCDHRKMDQEFKDMLHEIRLKCPNFQKHCEDMTDLSMAGTPDWNVSQYNNVNDWPSHLPRKKSYA
jgi:hypothetical protein